MAEKRKALEGPKQLVAITPSWNKRPEELTEEEQEQEKQRRKEERAAKRKSRWGEGEESKHGMPTSIDVNQMTDPRVQDIYLLQLQIRELTVRMGQNNLGLDDNPGNRSPSPEPIYNPRGVRINTRHERTKNKLQNQRNTAITKLRALDPSYSPPVCMNYKDHRLEDRVEIPSIEYPDLNFLGLILGPRGHCLERLRLKTGCTITLKGKGSKHNQESIDETMHVTISGTTGGLVGVKTASTYLRKLISEYCDAPNGPKMLALRESRKHYMQVLNGTLKVGENMKCNNCGGVGHKTWQCQDKTNVTNNTICNACGTKGHVAMDCKVGNPDGLGCGEGRLRNGGEGMPKATVTKEEVGEAILDAEYDAFLNDVDGGSSTAKRARPGPGPANPSLSSLLAKPAPKLMLTHDSPSAIRCLACSTGLRCPIHTQPKQQVKEQSSMDDENLKYLEEWDAKQEPAPAPAPAPAPYFGRPPPAPAPYSYRPPPAPVPSPYTGVPPPAPYAGVPPPAPAPLFSYRPPVPAPFPYSVPRSTPAPYLPPPPPAPPSYGAPAPYIFPPSAAPPSCTPRHALLLPPPPPPPEQ